MAGAWVIAKMLDVLPKQAGGKEHIYSTIT